MLVILSGNEKNHISIYSKPTPNTIQEDKPVGAMNLRERTSTIQTDLQERRQTWDEGDAAREALVSILDFRSSSDTIWRVCTLLLFGRLTSSKKKIRFGRGKKEKEEGKG
jgi:hypothetical protein